MDSMKMQKIYDNGDKAPVMEGVQYATGVEWSGNY